VLVGDVSDRRRQRVDDVKVRDREQLGLALGKPLACCRTLTLRAVPVAATIVADDRVRALVVLAARNMTSERRRAAALDGRHHLQLAKAHMAAIGITPSGA